MTFGGCGNNSGAGIIIAVIVIIIIILVVCMICYGVNTNNNGNNCNNFTAGQPYYGPPGGIPVYPPSIPFPYPCTRSFVYGTSANRLYSCDDGVIIPSPGVYCPGSFQDINGACIPL